MAIRLHFRGQDYTIPDNRAFAAGEAVEEIATLSEIHSWSTQPKFHKIARCFSELLNFAGAKTTPQEVLTDMMDQIKSGGSEGKELIAASAIFALVAVLMDGAPEGDGEEGKKANAS